MLVVVVEDLVGWVHDTRVYHSQWMNVGDRDPKTIKLISPRANQRGAWAFVRLTTNLFLATVKKSERESEEREKRSFARDGK